MPSTLNKRRAKRQKRRQVLHRIISNDLISRVSDDEYRKKVKRVYGGPKGALLAAASMVSLHIPLGKRLFRKQIRSPWRAFDSRRGERRRTNR